MGGGRKRTVKNGGDGVNAVEKRKMIIGVINISELAQAQFVFALT